jgi:hypothetical protein
MGGGGVCGRGWVRGVISRKDNFPVGFNAQLNRVARYWRQKVANFNKDAKPLEKIEQWFVYVCSSKDRKPTKIGISRNLQRRLTQLQDGNFEQLYFYFVVPFPRKLDAYMVEQQVLCTATNNGFECRGEWMNAATEWVIQSLLEETKRRDPRAMSALQYAGLVDYRR